MLWVLGAVVVSELALTVLALSMVIVGGRECPNR